MTPEEKLSNIPDWIGGILRNALAQAAAANGGVVPEESIRRAARLAVAFGAVPVNILEVDDGQDGPA